MQNILINGLTLLRIPLSLLFCGEVLHNSKSYFVCTILFVLIAASDYLDGKLARKYGLQSRIGAKLDVIADVFFILSSCLSLLYMGLIPDWIVFIIILKFLEFLITSEICQKGIKCATIFLFDPIGRIAAVLFYLLPIIVLLLLPCCSATLHELLIILLCTGITILAAVSSTFRITSLIKLKKKCLK